jgi:hypothetical protein
MVGICLAFSTSLVPSVSRGGKHAAHHAARAQMPDQRARIQVGDYRDAVLAQELAGFLVGSPVAGNRRELAHHQAFDVRARGFAVRGVGSVIPDLGIGQDDDLPGIGRIGEYFLVAGDGGIEDDFAGSLGGRTKTPALEDAAVFQGEDGRLG